MKIRTLLAAAFGVVGLMASTLASASLIGNPVVDRDNADSWSNFVLALTSQTFAHSGTVTNWSVWAANGGDLGLLILEDLGGNSYGVKAADTVTVAPGLNDFIFTPDSGSAHVQSGWLLGLWIGTGKVDFSSSINGESVGWCANNGCFGPTAPVAGVDTLSLGVGNNGGARTYSVQVTYVPEPGTLALFGLGLVGLAMGRKRWSNRTAPAAA